MTRASDINGWEHYSGYRLGVEQSIEYRRDDGSRIWIEGLRPDPGIEGSTVTYWGVFREQQDDGSYVDHGPKHFGSEEEAQTWLTETMRANELDQ